ncbi:MAG TPA: 4'-phosphopantetheinyl transferase superfamily protein [Pyrinomonadaceae bacterium]|nr:4'-phosphopantetheinyl transferase superfamily protein [Pyrinomonadaceae bacterium]
MAPSSEIVWRHPSDVGTLADQEVHIWRVSVSQAQSSVTHLSRLLDEEESKRAARFHFERDRVRFIVARGGLRIILGQYLKIDPAVIEFSYSAHGKPALSRAHSDSVIKFNLAHSHDLALYAFSPKRELGIDVEHMRPEVAGDDIAKRFFAAPEVDALRSLSAERRLEAFFNCWTRKEAYIKARGEGLTFPLSNFVVSMTPGEPASLLTVQDSPQEAARWSLQELDAGEGYAASVAVEGHDWRLKLWEGNSLLQSTDYADYTD